ncbi:MAG: thermonuclease family protein [Erythrobacter sp.]|uniref:thermonuclease family protein n=1 Tax=Erythrobacter sp. TaxID=1042 RepID=UPI0032EEF8F9
MSPRFRSPLRRNPAGPSPRMLTWWMLWRVPALLGIVMAAWWFGVRPVLEERGWVTVEARFAACGGDTGGADGCVVDGDTLVLFGSGNDMRRIRLTGFDAPELDGACEAERKAALRAKRALLEWLERGAFEWDGGADPPRDRYDRELRRVRRETASSGQEDLAEAMVARGLAARGGRGASTVDWCARE